MTGPLDTCARTTCAQQPTHLGGAHLDPRSPHYDGPDVALNALPGSCRRAAQDLLALSRKQGWERQAVDVALAELTDEIRRLKRQAAAVTVDKDRQVTAAMKRAEDCDQHGADIRYEGHQAYWFSRLADINNEQRVLWVDVCHSTADNLKDSGYVDAAAWMGRQIERAGKQQIAIAKRYAAPSHADCQRAGHCEHPATEPHSACRQLALFVVEGEEADQ